MVVGDSQTGEMDKIDGPYYFFKLYPAHPPDPAAMDAVRRPGIRGRVNIVPCGLRGQRHHHQPPAD